MFFQKLILQAFYAFQNLDRCLVPAYETSDSSSDDRDDHKSQSSPKKRVMGDWLKMKTFPGPNEAEKYINEKIWGFHYGNKTEEGIKKYFRCNPVICHYVIF